MKKLLLTAVLGLTLLSFTGCSEKEKTTTETSAMKCEAGKCGATMEKTEVPAQKSAADAKCGEGKCGDN